MNKILTFIRFLASFMVVFYHYFFRYFEKNGGDVIEFMSFGKIGVEMFFILSGYLLINSISKYTPLIFITKRVKRIYPTYFVSVIITLSVLGIFSKKSFNLVQVLTNLTFLNIPLGISSIDGVYWTLFIELTFYFSLLFLRLLFNNVPKIFITISLLTLVFRLYGFDNLILTFASLFTYGWLFAGGSALRLFAETGVKIYMAMGLFFVLGYSYYVELSVFEILLLLLTMILIVSSDKFKTIVIPNIFLFLGTISYPVYLVHQEIGYIIFDYFGWGLISIILAVSTTISLGWILHKYVETRFT